MRDLGVAGIAFKDLHTSQSTLEDIFVSLVGDPDDALRWPPPEGAKDSADRLALEPR